VWLRERSFKMRAQADRPLRSRSYEHAASLPRDDQTFVAEDSDRLLDRHAGDAVALG